MAMKLIKGFFLPASDTHFADHLMKGPVFQDRGTYQYNKISAALPHVQDFNLALDIGAHVGLWAYVLAHRFKDVIACEPVPENFECLEKNVEGLRVECQPFAIGRDGTLQIKQVNGNTGNSCVGVGQTVKSISLDTLGAGLRRIGFIKIDVEGFEMAVVQSGEKLIRYHRPTMVVEQKPGNAEQYQHRTGEVITLLKKWGATVVWQKSGDYCLVWQ